MSKKPYSILPAFLLCFLGLALGACSQEISDPPPDPRDFLRVRDHFEDNRRKIFLVAGSSTSANFAQEVIEQRQYFLDQGFSENEVACYYVIPRQQDFVRDFEQYKRLAPELEHCFHASVLNIIGDMSVSANRKEQQEFVYLYVSSHGSPPARMILDSKESRKHLSPQELADLTNLQAAFPDVMDRYLIAIDGGPDGSTAGLVNLLNDFYASQQFTPDRLFMAPAVIKSVLLAFDVDLSANPPALRAEKTKKFVTLQGCFTGGFLKDDRWPDRTLLLDDVPALSLMTASANDRPSFGCQPGIDRTYFGGAFTDVLRSSDQSLLERDWKALFHEVEAKVQKMEEEQSFEPSLPQFHQTSDQMGQPLLPLESQNGVQ